ncbi:MAG: methionine adenosyltransferase [Candidatus Eiseniibacteriota bacterium]
MAVTVQLRGARLLERDDPEIVERKGLGHPDTICDHLAESVSVALSRAYVERFGAVLHHNVDKVLLWGGTAVPAFGGGRILRPIEVFIAGRATRTVKGVAIPVDDIVQDACRRWLRTAFHAPDVDRRFVIHPLLRPGSPDLVDLFLGQERTGVWLANDTSLGVGYAPLSALERTVLTVEHALNSPAEKVNAPEIGEDIKVMGVRSGGATALTVGCAFVDRYVRDLDDYVEKRARLAETVRRIAGETAGQDVAVAVNGADDPARGSVYLTVTGTSAEGGDDGEAGRGNRANGLITPGRPMTMESVAGKNPVNHVGKLYNLAANVIAAGVVRQVAAVAAAECVLVSRIGRPVADPEIAALKLDMREGVPVDSVRPQIEAVVSDHLAGLATLWRGLLGGELAAVL